VYRGVYAVGHDRLTLEGRWMAAVLACGPGALLSHRDAAHLWGVFRTSRRPIDVTVTRGRSGQRGIDLHRARSLQPEDRAERDGISVTSLARTLLDLATVVNERRLVYALEEAERQRRFDLRAVEEACARARGHRGVGRLRRVLRKQIGPPPLTRSQFERAFIDLCRDHDLPEPAMNVAIGDYTVDALWPGHQLLVELDSYSWHSTRKSFDSDRRRDAALRRAGYEPPLRISDRWFQDDPVEVAETIADLLEASLAR